MATMNEMSGNGREKNQNSITYQQRGSKIPPFLSRNNKKIFTSNTINQFCQKSNANLMQT